MDKNERIIIDLPFYAFESGLLMALEKNTGAVPIAGEVLRILKIKMRKEKIYNQRVKNLRRGK